MKARPVRSWSHLALVASAAFALTVSPAHQALGDNLADEAELQFQLGAERYQANDFRGALEHFLASNRLAPNRNVAFNIARCFAASRRFPEAYRYYLTALEGETTVATRRAIEQAMSRIASELAIVRIETDPAGAQIYVDRRDLGVRGTSPVTLAFAPGTVHIMAERAGHRDAQSPAISLSAGSTQTLQLALPRIVGTVRVEGPLGAVAHLDDEQSAPLCTLPCTVQSPPGTHTLFVTQEGHATFSRVVQVNPDSEITVRSQLAALTGSLVVNASERDALVEVDGRPSGFAPAVVRDVAVGTRHVRVSLQGFVTVERDVVVRTGQPTELPDIQLRSAGEVTAASRIAERIEDAPASVSVIDGRELRAFAYPTIAEAIRGTRGIFLSNDLHYPSAGIRGVGVPGDYGNRLLTLADGHPLNDDVVGASYIGFDGRTDLDDVERIELVRGPGSVLYGTGAFMGVLNLVTRPRSTPTRAHAAFGTFGDVFRGRAGFTLNLGRDAGVWASVGIAGSGGADTTVSVPNADNTGPTLLTARNHGSFLAGTFAARAWYKDLTLQLFWSARDLSAALGAFNTRFNDPRTRFIDARSFAELRYEPKLGNIGRLFLRAHANLYQFRGAYTYDPSTEEDYNGTWYGVEARALFEPFRALRITVGGEFQHHPVVELIGRRRITASTTETYLSERQALLIGAGYLLLEGDPAPWLRYSAGARIDVYNTFGVSINPRAAVILHPVSSSTIKLTAGRAFRAPSVYELYLNDMGMTQRANPALRPETTTSGEIEYSQRFATDWVAVAAAHGSYNEALIETTGAGNMTDPLIYNNSTNPVFVVGGDVELRREWFGGWMFSAMYGYQRARDAITASELPNVPEHLASVRGVVPIVREVLSLASRLTLESPRPYRVESTPGAFSNSDRTPWAVVADVVATGHLDRFNIRYSVGVYNLFDWRYVNPVDDGSAHRAAPQPGRTFQFNLGVGY
ncbi:MAG: TonB-dependent receptor [Deltaproteobacteria bacterium]|nr:TonB-dependent receptor [Deltaproteobacteria bacterium]